MSVTVRQKRKGKGQPWHIFIHQDGIIRSKAVGDRRAAEAVASAVRRRLAAGEFNLDLKKEESKIPEFYAFATRYLESYAKTALKRNTWEGYSIIIENHLKAVWQGKRLDEITRAEVKRLLLQKQQDGYAPHTVQNIKALISGLFTHAYEDEILTSNPALKLGKYIAKTDRRRHVAMLTREQAARLLATAQVVAPRHHPMLLCALRTGMRLGELLGLTWDDVNFAANTIEVRRAYSHGHFTTPKSGKSRTVDMSDQLRATLLVHQGELVKRFAGHLPSYSVNDEALRLVFPNELGGPTDGDNFRHRVFYSLLEKADVPKVRFHDIRHTFASLLLQQGESLHYVKEQMGHASIQTTVDVYGHLVPGSNRNAVNRLDDATPSIRIVPAAG